jgi:hypothetical protein
VIPPLLVKLLPHDKYHAANLLKIPRRVHRLKARIGLSNHGIWYPDVMKATIVQLQALELMVRNFLCVDISKSS